MSNTLVYSIPTWSKDVDPLFATDKTMLFPDQLVHSSATDLYTGRRMSDSAISAVSGTTATDPNSPLTDPDPASPHSEHSHNKPSLPGIGALASSINYPRRSSLPTLTADIHLARSNRHSGRTQPPSAYAFPASPDTPALDFNSASTTTLPSFPSPPGFSSSLSPDYPPRSSGSLDPVSHAQSQQQQQQQQTQTKQQQQTQTKQQQQKQQSKSEQGAPSSSPKGSPKRRRSPASPPDQQKQQQQQPPPAQQQSPQLQPTQSQSQTQASQQQQQPPADGQPPIRRPRGKLPKHTTDLLKEWLHAHSDHPYPSEDEKRDLCARTKLSMSQVSNWMINARRRILAPAKPPAVSATTTEPYRGMGADGYHHSAPRSIGSMYSQQHHLYAQPGPGLVRRLSSEDSSLRLYNPPYHHHHPPPHHPHHHHPYDSPGPRYQAQGRGPHSGPPPSLYAVPHERRLPYPSSSVGSGGPYNDFPHAYSSSQLFLPNPGQHPSRDPPRYYTSPPDSVL